MIEGRSLDDALDALDDAPPIASHDETSAEDCMTSTPQHGRPSRRASKPSAGRMAVRRPARTVAFRLSYKEVRLIEQHVSALDKRSPSILHSPSDVMRSLLVTHTLLGNQRLDSVLFAGGLRVQKKKSYWAVTKNDEEQETFQAANIDGSWGVFDGHGVRVGVATGAGTKTVLSMTAQEAAQAARDVAILRAEWCSLLAVDCVEPEVGWPHKSDTKGVRLYDEERDALRRLAVQNGTNMSQVMRSFVMATIASRKRRLVGIAMGRCDIAPCRQGWAVHTRDTLVYTAPTLQEAIDRAEWEVGRAA